MSDNSTTSTKVKMNFIKDGPIHMETGTFEVTMPDGKVLTKEAPFWLCRCGESKKKPVCDGAHKECGFIG
ncbi:CDGSH iron-sulfur domain-containing protein [candidate division GN15 bacterium]|nr:CDGSH iron-sulfur domain-containing protein [candidate division GN15 bacterium]